MSKLIKINGKEIYLSDWKIVTQNDITGICYRMKYPNTENSEVIRLFRRNLSSNNSLWQVMFIGPNLTHLREIYSQIYSDKPKFFYFQLEEAKQHIDKFLDQVNSLVMFL